MAKTVRQLLEHYLEKAKQAKGTTVQQAKALGISAGHWSQLKNGKVKLTDDVIETVATNLSAKKVAKKEDVIRDLTRSRDAVSSAKTVGVSPGEIFDAVEIFFTKVSNGDSLVCVDYRDFPQTTKDGPYPTLGKKAAESIALGCSFSMFQPFGSEEEQQEKLIEALKEHRPPEGYMYLLRLANEVRQVYLDIKDAAEKKAGGKERIEGKIVLYEASEAVSLPGCGISSRMLYASYMEDERRSEQACQWVAGTGDRDYFIERGKSSISLEAIALQFDPIPAFWSKNKHLPWTKKLLEEASAEFGSGQNLKWQIWAPPKDAI